MEVISNAQARQDAINTKKRKTMAKNKRGCAYVLNIIMLYKGDVKAVAYSLNAGGHPYPITSWQIHQAWAKWNKNYASTGGLKHTPKKREN